MRFKREEKSRMSKIDLDRVNSVASLYDVEGLLGTVFNGDHGRAVEPHELIEVITRTGLALDDERIATDVNRILALPADQKLSVMDVLNVLKRNLLLETALTKHLVLPDFELVSTKMDECFEITAKEMRRLGRKAGQVSCSTPKLARVDGTKLAASFCSIHGQRWNRGDYTERFTVQEACGPLLYCIALDLLGITAVHEYVGREPSPEPFSLRLDSNKKPFNPFVQAGLIMMVSLIQPGLPISDRFNFVREVWAKATGQQVVGFANSFYLSQRNKGNTAFCNGYLMNEMRAFPGGEELDQEMIQEIINLYFMNCSIEASCESLAIFAGTLAGGGVCPITNTRVFKAEDVRCCLSMMSSCGMNDSSGSLQFTFGYPCKSSVSGFTLFVIPNLGGFCTFSPKLDENHISSFGLRFAANLVKQFPLHTFNSYVVQDSHVYSAMLSGSGADDDTNMLNARALRSAENDHHELFYAVAEGDSNFVRKLFARGVDISQPDYDFRTPLHVAASNGHLECVKLLVLFGANLEAKDRQGNRPVDDAKLEGRTEVYEWLSNPPKSYTDAVFYLQKVRDEEKQSKEDNGSAATPLPLKKERAVSIGTEGTEREDEEDGEDESYDAEGEQVEDVQEEQQQAGDDKKIIPNGTSMEMNGGSKLYPITEGNVTVQIPPTPSLLDVSGLSSTQDGSISRKSPRPYEFRFNPDGIDTTCAAAALASASESEDEGEPGLFPEPASAADSFSSLVGPRPEISRTTAARWIHSLRKLGKKAHIGIDECSTPTSGDLVHTLRNDGIRVDDCELLNEIESLSSGQNGGTTSPRNCRERRQSLGNDMSKEELTPSKVSYLASKYPSIQRCLEGHTVINDFHSFKENLKEVFKIVEMNREGDVARYIPQLASQDPEQFGIAVCSVDAQRFCHGDAHVPFCVQSCMKTVSYCIAQELIGEELVHRHVGYEPSGLNFNELTLNRQGLPHNPLINAGAIVTCSLILPEAKSEDRFDFVTNVWEDLTGGVRPGFSNETFLGEFATADRNFCLGYLMKEKHAFPEYVNSGTALREVLEFYFSCCSLELDCDSLSVVAATLANGGVNPVTQKRVFRAETVRNCLSIMASSGMYDFSGEFQFTIGVPAKSGVSGALLIVVPNVMGMCIWSPRLDRLGNSARGIHFCSLLQERYAIHRYSLLRGVSKTFDVRDHCSHVDSQRRTQRLIEAATRGDTRNLQLLVSEGNLGVDCRDYDGRTPMHLAASEGHLRFVKMLHEAGAFLSPEDRWGGTPLSDARRHGHQDIVEYLSEHGAKLGSGTRSAVPFPRTSTS